MKTQRSIKHHMEGLAALVLFGVFAVCILAVLLTGAGAYRRLTQRDAGAYDRRTAARYLSAKVRQADRLGAVTVEDFDGVDALVLAEELEGETYLTRIYCYDGYLRELFSGADAELLPEEGEMVLAARDLDFMLENGLLTAEVTDAAGETLPPVTLALRCGEGVVS